MNVQKVNNFFYILTGLNRTTAMMKTIKKNHTHSVLMTTIREDLGLRTSFLPSQVIHLSSQTRSILVGSHSKDLQKNER